MFSITLHRGFQLTFPNTITVSVQWGPANYCSNKDTRRSAELADYYDSKDAELGIWLNDGVDRKWIEITGQPVLGWASPQLVGEIIGCLAVLKDPTPHGITIRVNRIVRRHQTQPQR